MYVFVPAQAGSALTTGADAVSDLPQLSVTVGAAGAVARAGQATVDAPAAGTVKIGALIVIVRLPVITLPQASVNVHVSVSIPLQATVPVRTAVTDPLIRQTPVPLLV